VLSRGACEYKCCYLVVFIEKFKHEIEAKLDAGIDYHMPMPTTLCDLILENNLGLIKRYAYSLTSSLNSKVRRSLSQISFLIIGKI